MRRLSVRFALSHVAVAVLGGLATYVVVRLVGTRLFDESVGLGDAAGTRTPGVGQSGAAGRGAGSAAAQAGQAGQAGQGGTALKDYATAAFDQALLLGTVVGVLAAALFGILAARRLLRPLAAVGRATREIAEGRYDVRVPEPRDTELAALASDVNSLGSSLAETEARRVRLMSEVAHEMRTPLTVIDGTVEGMIDGVLPMTSEGLGRLSDETRRLRRLAEDLSTLSRAEEGRLSIAPVPVGLRALVAATAGRLTPQAEDAGLELVITPGDDIEAVADRDRLSQVVTNLVGNAIRATPPGGTITVSLERGGDAVAISVADTGEGLSSGDQGRVFERFYRVPGRRGGRADTGSGIGLTIARQIMLAHGGDLTVTSEGPGHGATFSATLPAA